MFLICAVVFFLVSVSSLGLFTYARENNHLLFWLISFATFLQMDRPKKNRHYRWIAYHSNCPCRFASKSMSFKKKKNSKTDEGYGHATHNKVDAMFVYALILLKPDKCERPVKG